MITRQYFYSIKTHVNDNITITSGFATKKSLFPSTQEVYNWIISAAMKDNLTHLGEVKIEFTAFNRI